MKKLLMLASILIALIAVSPAASHNGNIWFWTAPALQKGIVNKYTMVYAATCKPAPGAHKSYRQDSWGKGWYDHFLCTVSTVESNRCNVLAHITGSGQRNFVLTSRPVNGCSTRDLWG